MGGIKIFFRKLPRAGGNGWLFKVQGLKFKVQGLKFKV
jgi:hypothetical protein